MTALEWSGFTTGAVLVLLLMGGLLAPFLRKANRDGKRQLGRTRMFMRNGAVRRGASPPVGAGDNAVGGLDDPAPGMADGQSDPWSKTAQRGAPPIQS